ncbi:MAG: hypothetical protein NZ874_01270 [Fimbriimonadales bacterium]|nr:hypothetical protein [Fimbriimonadales bacterium]
MRNLPIGSADAVVSSARRQRYVERVRRVSVPPTNGVIGNPDRYTTKGSRQPLQAERL